MLNFCTLAALVMMSGIWNAPALADPAADAIVSAQARYQALIDAGGRYLEGDCQPPDLAFPGYLGFPVRECFYKSLGLSGRVYLLDPDARQLARWTVSACASFATARQKPCIRAVIKQIWSQSNAQFPVAGVVIEPQSIIGGSNGVGVNFEFRDGVTVKTAMQLNGTTKQLSARELEGVIGSEVLSSKIYGRPIGATREIYKAAGGQLDVGASSPSSARKLTWLKAVADAHKVAWNSDHHFMIDAWAANAASTGVF
jgi:hypothetical protein